MFGPGLNFNIEIWIKPGFILIKFKLDSNTRISEWMSKQMVIGIKGDR